MDARGDARKVVIDTGVNKEALLHNVKFLEVDLGDIDCVVISHDYGDHTAATVEVVEVAGGVKVHGHPPTSLPRFYVDKEGKRHRGGLPEGEGEGASEIEATGRGLVLSKEPVEVLPGVWTTGQVDRVTTFERILRPLARGAKAIIVIDGEEVNDQILDDLSMLMDVEGVGPFVITSCAHSGPVITLLQVKRLGFFERIYGLVGGTHLIRRSDEYLEQTIKVLIGFGLGLISPYN